MLLEGEVPVGRALGELPGLIFFKKAADGRAAIVGFVSEPLGGNKKMKPLTPIRLDAPKGEIVPVKEGVAGIPYAYTKTKMVHVATAPKAKGEDYAVSSLYDYMGKSNATKVARHENVGAKSPPDTLKPTKMMHFKAESPETNDFLSALQALTEISPCFKVIVKADEVVPTGMFVCTTKQCIIPAAGRYEFK